MAEIASTAEPQDLDFAQVAARIQESTPFAVLVDVLPRNRSELYALLAVLVAVLQLLSQRPTKVEVVTPDQMEHIIERIIEHQQQPEQPAPIIHHRAGLLGLVLGLADTSIPTYSDSDALASPRQTDRSAASRPPHRSFKDALMCLNRQRFTTVLPKFQTITAFRSTT